MTPRVFKRTFIAKSFPIGSDERKRLNEHAETSEYMPSYKWGAEGDHFRLSFKTKAEAEEFILTSEQKEFREYMKIEKQVLDRAKEMNLMWSDRMSLAMDLECAVNTFNINLSELLAADNFNFAHDLNGIQKHIDRSSSDFSDPKPKAEFTGCFVPRYARNAV